MWIDVLTYLEHILMTFVLLNKKLYVTQQQAL